MDSIISDKSNTDNDLYLPQSDSFWEIGKYSRVIKRCDDGNKLTTDLISMINERAELEKAFSKTLKSWSKKWSDYVAKSSEFGSMTSAWKAIMAEADATADVHQNVHDDLQNEVIPAIKGWQKGKYVKSMMHIKSTKEYDEEFKRAQKPWAKLYGKVDKYKREYHVATKNLKTAETQENNSKLDAAVPQEQRAKIAEKVERCRKEKDSAKVKYAEALQDLNRANPKYMDDMNDVFHRCQSFEKDRLIKFQEFLATTEKYLDVSNRLKSPIFQQFSQTIENCDPDKDLSWWSETYGATMKMNWPIFEESTNLDHHHHQQQQQSQPNYFSYSGDLSLGYDICYRRPLAQIVSQTNAAVLVVDSYATIRRSMRRTAAVVTRIRRDRAKREEYSESHRTLSRRGKGDIERENPVVVTAIRSNNNGPANFASPSDSRLSTHSINQSPAHSARSSVYPTLDTTATSYSNPFEDDEDDNDISLKEKSTTNRSSYSGTTNNGGYPSLSTHPTNDNKSPPYPAAANPFLDDDDVDSPPSSLQRSYQSPISTGVSSVDNSAGAPVRALYDYEAQEPDELSFKQGEVFTKLEDEDDQGWCKGRVGNRVGLYPATYVEVL
ncbi:unnamed protein product [Rotaria sordida]|uniref:Uncharacterized protein n=1 Tax=Rotaria sordida TaxID=392033 RepID=A0A819KY13_9BILA|nr:unnamed protein product [Rotaria sordida]